MYGSLMFVGGHIICVVVCAFNVLAGIVWVSYTGAQLEKVGSQDVVAEERTFALYSECIQLRFVECAVLLLRWAGGWIVAARSQPVCSE